MGERHISVASNIHEEFPREFMVYQRLDVAGASCSSDLLFL